MKQHSTPTLPFTRVIPFLAIAVFFFLWGPPQAEAAPRIKESRLDRKKDDVREPLYTKWMDPFRVGEFVAQQGGFPIYQAVNRKGESRVLLVAGMPRTGYYYYCLMSESDLITKHRQFTGQGLQLLTLSEDADGRFAATWVKAEGYDKFKAKLDELGISPATLKE